MPTLSGSTKAPLFATFGTTRFGATRFGYHSAHAFLKINAVQRRDKVEQSTLTITDALDEVPNRCTFTASGFTPTVGMEVIATLGSINNGERVFAGHVLQVSQAQAAAGATVFYQVSCLDYTWLLGKLKVTKSYTNQSATAIARDLIATYASGFTSRNVVHDLDTIDEITFTDEDLPTALTRIAKRIGAYWYVDYHKDVHLFVSETGNGAPVDLTTAHASLQDFVYEADLDQVITRVYVEGRGSSLLSNVLAGDTILPLESVDMFTAGAGVFAKVSFKGSAGGARHLTFAAVVAGGTGSVIPGAVAAPPFKISTNTPTIGPPNTIDGGAGTSRKHVYTFVTPAGESMLSPSVTYTQGGSDFLQYYSLVDVYVGPEGTTARRIYRTAKDGSTYGLVGTISDNTTTTFQDAVTDAGRGVAPPSGLVAAGSTTIPVMECASFSATGGWVRVGEQLIRYTGRSVSSGSGTLTGVPASGIGAIASQLAGGSEVLVMPQLTGIPASGAGSIATALTAGDDIYLVVQRDDTTAQTALATLIGGTEDGIREEWIQDRRLSITEAQARGDAILVLRSTAEGSLQYTCRDTRTASGKTITVSLGSPTSVSGAFKIQEVTISQFSAGGVYPTYSVRASTTRYSYEQLLRDSRRRGGA